MLQGVRGGSTIFSDEKFSCGDYWYVIITSLLKHHYYLCKMLEYNKESKCSSPTLHECMGESNFTNVNISMLLNHVITAYLKCSYFKLVELLFDNLWRNNMFYYIIMIVGFNRLTSTFRGWDELLLQDDWILYSRFAYFFVF